MGNIGTTSDFARIFVQTKEPYYFPHGYVEGSVYLQVFKSISALRLELIIKANEKVKWDEAPREKAGSQQSISETIKEQAKVFEPYQVILHSFSGNVEPGHYQFPFAFQLPEKIPGSFKLLYKTYEGSMTYSLTGLLISSDHSDLKHKAHITIREKPAIANYNSPVRATEKLCVCCLIKGSCALECIFQSDTFRSGDEAYVICKADNSECRVPIKFFALELIQHVTLRNKAGKQTVFKRKIMHTEFDGLEAGASSFDRPKLLAFVLSEKQVDLLTSKEEKEKSLLQPSVSGRLIDCRYTVEVYPVFDASFTTCSELPHVVLPLHIYARSAPGWVEEAPKEFNPIQYKVQQIIIPMNPKFDAKPAGVEEAKIKLDPTAAIDTSINVATATTNLVGDGEAKTEVQKSPPAPPLQEPSPPAKDAAKTQ